MTEDVLLLVTETGTDLLPYNPPDCSSVTILNLTSRPLTVDEVIKSQQTIETELIDINDRFHEQESKAATEYIDFVERLPERTGILGLTEASDSTIPFWWIATDFLKNSVEYDHSFNVYCRGTIVRKITTARNFSEGIVLTRDSSIREFYTSVLTANTDDRNHTTSLLLSICFQFVLGTGRIGIEILKSLIGRLLSYAAPVSQTDQNAVFLFTRSHQWEQYDWKKDRYYHDFPEILSASTSLKHSYAFRLSDTNFFTAVQQILHRRREKDDSLIVQSYAGVLTFLSTLVIHAQTCVLVYRFLRDCRGQCNRESLDLYPLIREDIVAALSTYPYSVIEYNCLKKMHTERDPALVVTPFFEGKVGRVNVAASREQDKSVPVVGLQHGPITRGKLQYHLRCADRTVRHDYAQPAQIAVDGAYAADVLTKGGYTDSTISQVGGPRYDHLFRATADASSQQSSGPAVVFFGRDDYRSMASIVIPVLTETDRRVLLKPHPSVRKETITHLKRSFGSDIDKFKIVGADADELIRQSAVVISSYSSTAVETLALDTPLISIVPRNRLDPTPFDDTLVPQVQSEQQFRDVLESPRDIPQQEKEEFLNAFFGPRDGQAAQRLTDLCVEITADK